MGSIAYRLRESPRARHVLLRVTLHDGFEVIVPRGFDVTTIPAVLARHAAWIQSALERTAQQRRGAQPAPVWEIPPQIELPAVGITWEVSGRETEGGWVAVRTASPTRLEMAGQITDESTCRKALARWLVRQAQEHLTPQLQALGRQTGLHHTRVSVRLQRTRWGSCSRDGAISLNARLLFLPPPLVEYVLVHELCHTITPNHSEAFWELVQRHAPDYRKRRAELRAAWRLVPCWAFGARSQQVPG
jgi:predicted metal-dependent hydrolase